MSDRPPQPVWRSLGAILLPWETLGFSWWVGIHWTLIGLAALNAVAVLIALGAMVERLRRGVLTPIEALVLVEHYIETHFCKSGCEIDADNPLGADGYCEGCHEYGGEGCP